MIDEKSTIMKNIKRGIEEGIIELVDNESKIIYYASKEFKTNFKNPEEKVRASYFVELVLDYKYPPNRIDFEVQVPRRTPTDRADIVVFEDDELKKPFIVVECKREGITDAEFEQAIEQLFGNANSLKAKYGIVVAGLRRRAFNIADYPPLERKKNIISDIPIKYGKPVKYRFKKGGNIFEELKVVSRDELIRVLEKVHDTVWQGGKLAPTTAFDEVSKLIFCKIWDEKTTRKGEYYRFQIGSNESAKDVFDRIKKIYEDAKKKDPYVFAEDIKLEPEIVYSVVEQLQEINLKDTDLDTKGVAFERFMEDFFKGKMGQYFTPREIINFMVEFAMLHFDEDEYLNLKVLDPACGSGGFLLHVLDFIRRWAEGNYDKFEAYQHWHEFAKNNIYGIEINEQISRVCKMNMILHDDGHTNIISFDALEDFEKIEKIHKDFKKGSFDLILTNPPFGAKIKKSERKYIENYELGKGRTSQKTEILFIERCWEFLKEGGILGIVLPDGILTNSTLQYVRDFILNRFRVLAVISLPNFAFTHYGAGVKSSLVFLQKKKEGEDLGNYPIFMAIAEHIGYDATGRKDEKNDLPDILEAYKEFLKTGKLKKNLNFEGFIVYRNELEGRLDAYYYKDEFRELEKKLKKSKFKITTLGKIAHVFDGPFGSELKNEEYVDSGIPLIRVQNIKDNRLVLTRDNTVYISVEKHQKLKRSEVLPGDVVVTKTGWLGNAAVVPEEVKKANIRADIAGIRIKSEEISPEYLAIYISSNIGKKLCYRLSSGSTRDRIIIENLRKLKIIVPPKDIQEKIVQIMENAYKLKKQKEKEAEELLNSIDDYVLKELGIEIPEIEESKIFIVDFNDIIKNKRLDAEFNQEKYKILMDAVEKGKYKTVEVGKVFKYIKKGIEVGSNAYTKEGIPFIRVSDIDDYKIHFENADKKINPKLYKELKDKYKPQVGDLLYSKDGTIGFCVMVEEDRDFIISGGILRLKVKDNINPYYIKVILSTKLLKTLAEQRSIGAVIKHLREVEFKKLKIPLPPKEIQDKIAEEVKRRIKKAQQLKKESKKVIEEAKKEVEKILLGE
ncbi:N-6 DNA methylase [Methanocaldococcus fervens]|uniref:N-6 DNA methylase n=1 Tax=Methanocaldococcus fervens (strain DSM 4213 / JCM 15782 / AG86) TaxID=573064 RepID=C7P732_METFA|nr:N-6 DNA methylase [Methanocaldococcus fervens]ACV24364.1 N-6 DNA methylase [Methanocaldococcus fervens AG86]